MGKEHAPRADKGRREGEQAERLRSPSCHRGQFWLPSTWWEVTGGKQIWRPRGRGERSLGQRAAWTPGLRYKGPEALAERPLAWPSTEGTRLQGSEQG